MKVHLDMTSNGVLSDVKGEHSVIRILKLKQQLIKNHFITVKRITCMTFCPVCKQDRKSISPRFNGTRAHILRESNPVATCFTN